MTRVLAFHGQGSSPSRMRYDCGNPGWITDYPDWRQYKDADSFAASYCFAAIVLIGYSLGGEFIAELTRTKLASAVRGIIVYESPARTVAPSSLDCPVKIIWNDYEPWFRWRKAKKANSIYRWTRAFPNAEKLTGSHTSHIKRIPVTPFVGQAWDTGLNEQLGQWVGGIES